MMAMNWKISAYMFAACIVAIIALMIFGGVPAIMFLGGSIGTILDPRFVALIVVLAIFIRRVNILLLALAGSLILNAYFHLTLQEIWKELGSEHQYFDDVVQKLFAFVFVMCGIHAAWGAKFAQAKEPRSEN